MRKPETTHNIFFRWEQGYSGCSLVRLVAVPHFDSPFDETNHVFILNRGRARGKRRKRNDEDEF